jgi:hypothetical protein
LPLSQESEAREELIRGLEQLSGRTIRTREDVREVLKEISARKAGDDPSVQRWKTAKRVTLLVVLSAAFLQYYFLDVALQIMSLREMTYFVPVSPRILKSMHRTPEPARTRPG